MNDSSSSESAQAAREARDAVVSRPRGSKAGALADAMRRYLGAETYDALRKSRAEKDEDETPERHP